MFNIAGYSLFLKTHLSAMLKIYSVIYRTILVLGLILYLGSIFLVGVAGHVSNNNNSDTYFLAFTFITFFSLVFQQKFQGTARQVFRFASIILITIGALAMLWQVLAEEHILETGTIIAILVILAFVVFSFLLVYELIIERKKRY